jgi:tRNA(fMet)-specific endonuclease VapC
MSVYTLDTNIVSYLIERNSQVETAFRAVLRRKPIILTCPVVWYEVRRGLVARNAQTKLRRFEQLFATFRWDHYDQGDWELAGDLWAQRRALGRPIADADLLIAVFARNRNATLVTNNEKDFDHLGVVVENWRA